MPSHETSSKLRRSWIVSALVLLTVAGIVAINLNLALYLRLGHVMAAAIERSVLSFDYGTITLLNRFAHRSWTLDKCVYLIDGNSLATFPLLMAFWWYWFKGDEEKTRHREIALYGIVASFVAVVLARILAESLPFRERPLRNPQLHFQLPYSMRPESLLGWSAFPSDHGALWFALVATIFFISRRAGVWLFLYATLGLALARMYLGIHYPTDILVGGLLGMGVASLGRHDAVRQAVTRRPLEWMNKAPQVFYACLFVVTAQMAEGFSSTHELYVYLQAVAGAVAKFFGAS